MEPSDLYQGEVHLSPVKQVWRRFQQNHIALVGLWFMLLVIVVSIVVPWFLPYSPTEQNPAQVLIPPSWNPNGSVVHLFGTDDLGRDVFTRILYGSRTTFFAGFIVVCIAFGIGTILGVFAGMYRGIKSSTINHLLDVFMALPTLLIAIVIVAILGPGLSNLIVAISLAMIPKFVHSARSFVRTELQKEYILAARLDGASHLQLVLYSVLPNMLQLLIVQTTLAFTTAILDVTALGFLRLGVEPPQIELGAMIGSSAKLSFIAPWTIILPGIFIIAIVISINLVGDGLRSALEKS